MVWADYVITAVKYDEEKKHIIKVEVWADKGEKLGEKQVKPRTWVVSEKEKGKTFVTATKSNGKWKEGEPVHVFPVKGTKYIRTDRDEEERDNLENLPEF